MSNTAMLRNACTIAWPSTSLPGEPNGSTHAPGLIAIAGLADMRGRRPGPTFPGWLSPV